MKKEELKEFLDAKTREYNQPQFIETDPIQIPHQFSRKEDIEIAGFLVATISWGNRKSILKNADRMMELLERQPYEFVMHHTLDDLERFQNFVHRTFNSIDLQYFIQALRHIYINHGGLEQVFTQNATPDSLQPAISEFKKIFFQLPHLQRTEKHVSDPAKNSAAKRINISNRVIKMVRN